MTRAPVPIAYRARDALADRSLPPRWMVDPRDWPALRQLELAFEVRASLSRLKKRTAA